MVVGLFDGTLAAGIIGLLGMAGLQLGHGSHAGNAGHGGDLSAGHGMHVDSGAGMHLDSGHGMHVDSGLHMDPGHGMHVDSGHGMHVDSGHGLHAGTGHHWHIGHHHVSEVHSGHSHAGQAEGGEQADSHEAAVAQAPHIHAPLWLIPSPLMIFSWLIGFGAAGLIVGNLVPWLNYYVLISIAVVNAFFLERCVVRPYWDFMFRFASTPGTLLQGTVATKGTAVTSFDAAGHGLVRLVVDGQTRDVLAHLIPGEARLPVHKGDTLFIERANDDNSVVVSKSGPALKSQE